ncbi:MAG: AAA family ATPase, partial [Methylovulum sp.]|nr:AAA family ATPase [Methylovulum sp.]
FIPMDELASEWDTIVYTEHEQIVTDALKIILPDYEHLVFVENERSGTAAKSRRIAKVKLANQPRPVPLKSLGDGMVRILQIAIKLVSAQGGFLLIDEFENGLHYSSQEKIWSWLFTMAERLDIQVFATTHNWDCIESFATVALQHPDQQGLIFRMGKSVRTSDFGKVIATVFSGEDLAAITQANMEVR